jgi:hypothetical protein
MKIIIIFLLLLSSNLAFSQINLPKGFRCVDMSQKYFSRDNYFTDELYSFHSEIWREFENQTDFINSLVDSYKNSFKIKKTKDGLYWGSGILDNEYKYIILIPDKLVSIVLSSKLNGSQFSNYSTWLLQSVRNNLSSGKDLYFTDNKGRQCGGY